MDKWKAVQIGGFTALVLVVGAQVWKDPGTDESHSHKESNNGPGEPVGRAAMEVEVSVAPAYGVVVFP